MIAEAFSASAAATASAMPLPRGACVSNHTGMFSAASAEPTRAPIFANSERCEPSTSMSAIPSSEVMHVGFAVSRDPWASTSVPGSSGRSVLRMRIGIPDSISGTIVRGCSMRRPRPASSRASP